MKTKIFLLVMAMAAFFVSGRAALADYNTYTWGPGYRLYFGGVAPISGGNQGISLEVYKNSYVSSYTLDVSSLRVIMYSGSNISLKSTDRKLFQSSAGETVCGDDYSTFDYATPYSYEVVTINLTDGNNCPVVDTAETTPAVEGKTKINELGRIDIMGKEFELNKESASTASFIHNSFLETIKLESAGATEVKLTVAPLNVVFNLGVNKSKNLDLNADIYRDVKISLEQIVAGQVKLRVQALPAIIAVGGIQPGDLLKIGGSKAVYYYGPDSQRYVFPHERVYFTWYADFKNVKTIGDEDMAKLPIGGLVTYRPGVKMVKFTTNPDVYAVSKSGTLRKLKDEAMAKALYGETWNKQIDDINDAFYSSYGFGANLVNNSDFNKTTEQSANGNITVDKEI